MILISLILDKQSADLVRIFATLPNVHSHHVTMAYNPTPAQREQFSNLIGKKIVFKTIEFVSDDKAQAFLVEGVPSLNTHPHVTVACDSQVPPVYSNRLLASKEARRKKFELELSGTVTEEIK